MKIPTSVFAGVTMALFGAALVAFQLTVTDSMPAPIKDAVEEVVLPKVEIPALSAQAATADEPTPVGLISLRLPTPTPAPGSGGPAGIPAPAPPAGGDGTDPPTANANANLRSGPGTNYPIVGGVKAGDRLALSGSTSDGKWTKLASGSWIASSLVDGRGGGGSGGAGLSDVLVAASRSAGRHTNWPRASLADSAIGFAYPPDWTADGKGGAGAGVGYGNSQNPAQRVHVAPSSGRHTGNDPFGVMSIVRNMFADDPHFADSGSISFQIVTTGTLELPGAPVFTTGLVYVAPEIPPVCIVTVEAPIGDEMVSLVFMDYANPDATAEGLATLVPMVESLSYAAANE